jgi:zinc protease
VVGPGDSIPRSLRKRAVGLEERAARQRLVYEKELVTTISAPRGGRSSRVTSSSATVKAGRRSGRGRKEIDAVVAELIAKGPTAAELKRAHSRDLAGFTRGIERLGGFGGRSDVLAESR